MKIIDFVRDCLPADAVQFSMICEKEPIVGQYDIEAKVIYIKYKLNNGKLIPKYPDTITNPYIIIKETKRRRLINKKKPFWVNGETEIKTYKDKEFINYDIKTISQQEEEMIKKLRKKYNLKEPEIFEGQCLGLDFDFSDSDNDNKDKPSEMKAILKEFRLSAAKEQIDNISDDSAFASTQSSEYFDEKSATDNDEEPKPKKKSNKKSNKNKQ